MVMIGGWLNGQCNNFQKEVYFNDVTVLKVRLLDVCESSDDGVHLEW